MTTVREYIDARIKGIENDPRFRDKPAHVLTNAPLAIEQIDMKARRAELIAIRRLLGEATPPVLLAEHYGGPFSYHLTKAAALERAAALEAEASPASPEWTVYEPDDNGRLRAVASWEDEFYG